MSGATALAWGRRLGWALAGLFCLERLVPYAEIDQRFPAALIKNDYSTAESILDRDYLYGRDSTILRLRLANQLVESETPAGRCVIIGEASNCILMPRVMAITGY